MKIDLVNPLQRKWAALYLRVARQHCTTNTRARIHAAREATAHAKLAIAENDSRRALFFVAEQIRATVGR